MYVGSWMCVRLVAHIEDTVLTLLERGGLFKNRQAKTGHHSENVEDTTL